MWANSSLCLRLLPVVSLLSVSSLSSRAPPSILTYSFASSSPEHARNSISSLPTSRGAPAAFRASGNSAETRSWSPKGLEEQAQGI
ncbi:hypothetical protein R3P38DRAFT_2975767 [Favolaschia claudopus]|uniref:Secreted protein n=1 Tax=Favolaschia claudopus TaxID=2862362 RepID=A0AAW0B376_9AGAR